MEVSKWCQSDCVCPIMIAQSCSNIYVQKRCILVVESVTSNPTAEIFRTCDEFAAGRTLIRFPPELLTN